MERESERTACLIGMQMMLTVSGREWHSGKVAVVVN
jgi:hypothetical protein